MHTKTVGFAATVAALFLLAPFAGAQGSLFDDDDDDSRFDRSLNDETSLFGRDGFDDVNVGDRSLSRSIHREFDRDVDLDRENAFIALALGFDGSTSELLDIDQTVTRRTDLERTFDLEEEDAFLALALDGGFDGGSDEDLFLAGSDVIGSSTVERELHRDVDLDRDLILLRAFDDGVDFDDVAEIEGSEDVRVSADRDVDFDEEDTLSLLALRD